MEGGGEGGKEGAAHLVFTAGRQPGALDGRCQKYERHLHLFFLGFQPSIGYISSEHSVQPLLSGKVATWWGFEVFVGGGKDAALTYQQIGALSSELCAAWQWRAQNYLRGQNGQRCLIQSIMFN